MNGCWYKSSYSTNHGGNCVECRAERDTIDVRDTQNRAAGYLSFSSAEWSVFLAGVRADEL